jgi:hypothetical protein
MEPARPTPDSRPTRPGPATLLAGLRRTRASVLALLGVCAVVIALHGFDHPEPPPDRWATTLGVGLGLGTVVLRRLGASPRVGPRTGFLCMVASLALAGGLGLLGAWMAWRIDATRTGILFTLAGTIFAVRPITGARAQSG